MVMILSRFYKYL